MLRTASRRENSELRALDADVVTQALATERREQLDERDTRMLSLRDERRHLSAERDALEAAQRDGLPLEAPRAHLGVESVPDEVEGDTTQVRSRLLRIWAAVSTPLLMVVIVWLLIGTGSGYYWVGALAGVLLVIGFEALARRRLLAFLVWVVIVAIGTSLILGLVQRWQYTLAALFIIGAVVLLLQNLKELRSSR